MNAPAMDRLLVVENHDSFSWNLIDRLPFDRSQIEVIDGRDAVSVIAALDRARAVVIGPGPMDPVRAGLVDVVLEVERRGLPLLGICLGHQAIGLAHGARLIRSTPVHGRREAATFVPSRLLPGLAGVQQVMRYHSLSIVDVSEPLRVVARTADGTVMAVEHRTRPTLGLQFHPDSFGTPEGARMLAAFFEAVR